MPYVDLVDVAAAYQRTRVLDGVSFGVDKGQIVSLIGPSGSGRSTVLRVLMGLLPPTGGHVSVGGARVDYANRTQMRDIRNRFAVVFQQYNLFQNMCALDNVTVAPVKVQRRPRREVEAERAAGVARILAPCSHFDTETVAEIAGLGAVAEFSFFFVSHATQVDLTHVDAAKNAVAAVPAPLMAERLRAAGAENAILSSDCGVFLLPPPVGGLREFLLLMREAGFSDVELRRMSAETPARLFRVGGRASGAL